MNHRTILAAGLLVALFSGSTSEASAQLRLAVEAFAGGALNAPTTLRIRQNDEQDIEMNARYDTRAFEEPYYWSVRLSLLDERRAFELQLTHHKLYLSNPPPEVQNLEITHGFNMLTLGYAHRTLPIELRAGGGVVLAKPEGNVRGRRYAIVEGGLGGYRLSGPVLLAGLGKRFRIFPRVLATLDSDLVAAWANDLDVLDGSFDASNVALHLRFGLGYAF